MRVTVSSPELVTHTKRRPTKIPAGLEPTPIGVPMIDGVARSIRLTVLSLRFATHTSCLPSEIASGRLPTGTFAVGTISPSAWKRATSSEPALASHTTPLPATIPSGRVPASSGSPIGLFGLGVDHASASRPAGWRRTPSRRSRPRRRGPSPTLIVAATRGLGRVRRSRSPRAAGSSAALRLGGRLRGHRGGDGPARLGVISPTDHAGRRQPGGRQPGHQHRRQPDPDRELPPPPATLLTPRPWRGQTP